MRFSLQVIVGVIVLLLFLASAIALYFAASAQYTIPLLLVAVINVEAVIFLVFLITRGVISPLKRIQSIMQKVGEGDLGARISLNANKEIRDLADSLNDMIGKIQTAQLHEKEVERLKTEFVSLAAHQLRTPLSAMKWTLGELLDGDLGRVAKKQREFLSKTYDTNEKMIGLINDLLNLARFEGGTYLSNLRPLRLKEFMKSLAEWYKEEADRRGIRLVYQDLLPDDPAVLADEEGLRLAIRNFIENALRYTLKGGTVTICLSRDTENVEISVADTGIGIPKNQQAQVFEKFFRAENAKKVETDGSGLGLYLTKNIIEAHKGKVRFVSEEQKGSTFVCELPLTHTA